MVKEILNNEQRPPLCVHCFMYFLLKIAKQMILRLMTCDVKDIYVFVIVANSRVHTNKNENKLKFVVNVTDVVSSSGTIVRINMTFLQMIEPNIIRFLCTTIVYN